MSPDAMSMVGHGCIQVKLVSLSNDSRYTCLRSSNHILRTVDAKPEIRSVPGSGANGQLQASRERAWVHAGGCQLPCEHTRKRAGSSSVRARARRRSAHLGRHRASPVDSGSVRERAQARGASCGLDAAGRRVASYRRVHEHAHAMAAADNEALHRGAPAYRSAHHLPR